MLIQDAASGNIYKRVMGIDRRDPPPPSPLLLEAMNPNFDQIVDAVVRLAEDGKVS